MDFKNFIFTNINKLSKKFSHLSFRAEQNDISGFYFIEICPATEFRNNDNLGKEINNIYLSQLETFPSESLSFISTDSFYKIKDPFLKIEATSYNFLPQPPIKIFHSGWLFNDYKPILFHKLTMYLGGESVNSEYGHPNKNRPHFAHSSISFSKNKLSNQKGKDETLSTVLYG